MCCRPHGAFPSLRRGVFTFSSQPKTISLLLGVLPPLVEINESASPKKHSRCLFRRLSSVNNRAELRFYNNNTVTLFSYTKKYQKTPQTSDLFLAAVLCNIPMQCFCTEIDASKDRPHGVCAITSHSANTGESCVCLSVNSKDSPAPSRKNRKKKKEHSELLFSFRGDAKGGREVCLSETSACSLLDDAICNRYDCRRRAGSDVAWPSEPATD